MYNSDEKPKNKRPPGIYISNTQIAVIGVAVLVILLAATIIILRTENGQSALSPALPNGTTVAVDSAQGWQPTGLNLEEGQFFIIQYVEGDWSIWPEDAFRYGPDGGAVACNATDCVEPLRGYTKSGLIGRIGDSEPFVVGSYLETTASRAGMLQLRVNDGGTHDNEGIITMLLSLGD
jgi:hypothetical protein